MQVSANSPALAQSLSRATGGEAPEANISLLKKTLDSEKAAIAQFLPPQGLVDIRA